MKNLINIHHENGQSVVDARELHSFLKQKSRFNDWIKRRIEEYEFPENEDFILPLKKSNKIYTVGTTEKIRLLHVE